MAPRRVGVKREDDPKDRLVFCRGFVYYPPQVNPFVQLLPHQEAGVSWLMDRPRAALYDDQGLGKTAQAIVAADGIGARRVLVVCPAVVTRNWQREFGMWSPTRTVEVVGTGRHVIGAASVVVMSHAMLLREAIVEQLTGFDLVVLDEAHFFRRPTAARTRAFFLGGTAVCRRSRACWALSGSPTPNNDPSEMWSTLAGLAPERLRHDGRLLSYHDWRRRFCALQPTPYGDRVVGVQNRDELRQRLAGFGLRRMKSDTLNLPPVRHGFVALSEEDADLTRLEAEFGPVADLDALRRDSHFAEWRRLCGEAKADPAAELIAGDLDGGTSKVVVFAHHASVIDTVVEKLAAYNPVRIVGSQSSDERAESVRRFQNDASVRVCVANIVAGGVGVTLTAASDVVFVEESFVPGDNAQACDRVCRIGQTRPVLIRHLFLAGSVDEVVTTTLARKAGLDMPIGKN